MSAECTMHRVFVHQMLSFKNRFQFRITDVQAKITAKIAHYVVVRMVCVTLAVPALIHVLEMLLLMDQWRQILKLNVRDLIRVPETLRLSVALNAVLSHVYPLRVAMI